METKDIISELRIKSGLSQDELAKKCGISMNFLGHIDVSINTLLGSPRKLICQCCGMPLDDSSISKETDGAFNEEYCKWCYINGKFTYTNYEEIIDFCAEHMSNENWSSEQVRTYMKTMLPKLSYWQNAKK